MLLMEKRSSFILIHNHRVGLESGSGFGLDLGILTKGAFCQLFGLYGIHVVQVHRLLILLIRISWVFFFLSLSSSLLFLVPSSCSTYLLIFCGSHFLLEIKI